jgi:ABC-type lipoprotein release transport system permease subunit
VAVAAFVVVVLGSVIPAARAGRIDTLRAIAME